MVAVLALAILTSLHAPPAQVRSDSKDVGVDLRHLGYQYYGLGCQDELVYSFRAYGMTEEGTQVVNYKGLVEGVPAYSIERDGALSMIGNETVQLTKRGVVLTSTSLGTLKTPTLALPADVKVGSTWSETETFTRADQKTIRMTSHYRVVAKQMLRVPAGEFECLKIHTDGTVEAEGSKQPFVCDSYDAPGFGVVKLVLTTKGGDLQESTTSLTLKAVKIRESHEPLSDSKE